MTAENLEVHIASSCMGIAIKYVEGVCFVHSFGKGFFQANYADVAVLLSFLLFVCTSVCSTRKLYKENSHMHVLNHEVIIKLHSCVLL